MKYTVRRNCFETNSSSMHSIVVSKNDERVTHNELCTYKDKYTEARIWSESDLTFGRYPFGFLSEFEEKLAYVIASFCGYKNRKYCEAFIEKLEGIIREEIPEFKKIVLPTESGRVFLDSDGNELDREEVHWDRYETNDEGKEESVYIYTDSYGNKHEATEAEYWKEYTYYGNVDHQSSGLLQGFLKKENVTIKDFLFNKRYIVIIDGDEYGVFDKFKNSGLYSEENVDFEFPRPVGEYGKVPYDSVEYFEGLKDIK
jgi:hypothetical protein